MSSIRNRPLVGMAILGIALYFAVIAWSLASGEKLEEAADHPPVSRAQAEQKAVDFLRTVTSLGEPQTDAVYQSNQPASAYIAKQKLEAEYDKQLGAKFPLDYWDVRVADGNHTYHVQVGLEQPVIGGWKTAGTAPAELPGDKLAAEKAVLASGYSLNDFTYTAPGAKSNTHVFTAANPTIGEAKLKLQVDVSAGQVVGLRPDLTLPDSFTAWFDKQNRSAQWLSFASLGASFVMGIVALVFVILKAKHIKFSRGIVLTLLFAAIYIVHTFNSMPGTLAAAGAEDSGLANALFLVLTIGLIVLMAAALYISALSGEQLWRQRGWASWPRWREDGYGEHVWRSMGRGYLICLFILGVQQVLFVVAEKSFDAFAISDPSQSVLNMHYPIVFPTLAWMAGISEEILFRLFGIVVLRMLLRNTFAAVLLSGFIWALGHAAYAIYPSYTRLFEVTVLGIIFGYTFLRYGLITAIFAHATMDSILMAMSLLFTGGAANVLAGLFYIALPLLIAGAMRTLHSRFRKPPIAAPPDPAG